MSGAIKGFKGITLQAEGLSIPLFDETGRRRTREELAQIATQINAETNGGYSADTFSHNYATDRLESRRNKVKRYDCPQVLRKRAILARLQNKLINQKKCVGVC